MNDDDGVTGKGSSLYQQLIADPDGPYPFASKMDAGYTLLGQAPYPDVQVLSNRIVHVRSLKYQVLNLQASNPEETRVEQVSIGRLIAELEGDAGEVEVQRFLLPTEEDADKVDTSRCAACLMQIPEGAGIVIDGAAYHQRCYIDGEN